MNKVLEPKIPKRMNTATSEHKRCSISLTSKEILSKVTIRNPFRLSDRQRLQWFIRFTTAMLARVGEKQAPLHTVDENYIDATSLESG